MLEARRSFADIVSTEIENRRGQKKDYCYIERLQPGRLDENGYYVCGTGDETGRHTEKFSALATRESQWRASARLEDTESMDSARLSKCGYTDSESDAVSFAAEVEPLENWHNHVRAFRSLENKMTSSAMNTGEKRPRADTRNQIKSDYSVNRGSVDKWRTLPAVNQRETTPSLPRGRSTAPLRARHLHRAPLTEKKRAATLYSNEKTKGDTYVAQTDAKDRKIRELIEENLELQKKIENLTEERIQCEADMKKLKNEMFDSMASKHEKRIRLIKEEFDYRLDQEKERATGEITSANTRVDAMSQRIREMEQRICELEVLEKVALEKVKTEERRADTEAHHRSNLENQINASLSTVTQFSEKNLQLSKKIETLKAELENAERNFLKQEDTISRLRQNAEEGKEKMGKLDSRIMDLTTLLEARCAELKECQNDVISRDQIINELSQSLNQSQELLSIQKTANAKIETKLTSMMQKTEALESENNVLKQRHKECLQVAHSAWDEATAMKDETSLLRRQLEQRDKAVNSLKKFAQGHHSRIDNVCINNKPKTIVMTSKELTKDLKDPIHHDSQSTHFSNEPQQSLNQLSITSVANLAKTAYNKTFQSETLTQKIEKDAKINEENEFMKFPSKDSSLFNIPRHVSNWLTHSKSNDFKNQNRTLKTETDKCQADIHNCQDSLEISTHPQHSYAINSEKSEESDKETGESYHEDEWKSRKRAYMHLRQISDDGRIHFSNMNQITQSTPTTASASPFEFRTTTADSEASNCNFDSDFPFYSPPHQVNMSQESSPLQYTNSNTVDSHSSQKSSHSSKQIATKLVKIFSDTGQCRYELQSYNDAENY